MIRRAWIVAAVAAFGASSAHAQSNEPSADARAAADALFTSAKQLMTDGRYDEACGKLAESYRLEPAGGTLLNLARCYEKIGRVASAWASYRDSIDLARRASRPDREKVARDAMTALEGSLPRFIVHVPPDSRVAGLTVDRGGVALEAPSWETSLPVDPGDVVVEARAPGYVPWSAHVTASLGGTSELTVPRLAPDAPPAAPAPITPAPIVMVAPPPAIESAPPAPPSWWTPRRTIGVSLVAAGVVSIGVGAYFGARSLAKRSDSDAECPSLDGRERCTIAGAQAMSDAQTYAWVSDVTIGVGAAAAIAGTVLLVTSRSDGAPRDVAASAPIVRFAAAPIAGGGATFVYGAW